MMFKDVFEIDLRPAVYTFERGAIGIELSGGQMSRKMRGEIILLNCIL